MIPEFDTPPPAPPAGPPSAPITLRFTGSGSEYFRIWIVNLALTFITFGIYSAWAKVRRLQYFYRNTRLAGSGFDYHGKPTAILKGRVIAFGLLFAYQATAGLNSIAGLVVAVAIAAVLPWLLVRSLAFRMMNSSWRGLRFRFDGSVSGGYAVFLGWPLAAVLTLGLLAPAAHRALKAYQHGNAGFGTAPFAFSATTRQFYGVWLRASLLFGVVPIAAFLLFAVVAADSDAMEQGLPDLGSSGALAAMFVIALGVYGATLAAMPYFTTRIQNLVWNHTTLGPHRFESRLKFRRMLWIAASNFGLTIVTLGLFRPFAMVRMARYRAESMTLVPGESLDHFLGIQAREVEALGEEMSEFLDIDIAL